MIEERKTKNEKDQTVVAAAALFGCMCGLAGTVTVEEKGSVTRRPDGMQLKFSVDAIDRDMAKTKTMLAEKHAKIKEDIVVADKVDVKWEIK